jgi:hypothetical protein
MRKHLGNLDMRKRPDLGARVYEILAKISFTVTRDGKKYRITALPGFIFDGASIPWIFWTLVGSPFTGRYVFAALMHDIIFGGEFFDRPTCNWMMLEEMQKDGCWWITRNTIWLGIKTGSWTTWMRHTPESIAECRKYATMELIGGKNEKKPRHSHRNFAHVSVVSV